jgi:hypothetical protein
MCEVVVDEGLRCGHMYCKECANRTCRVTSECPACHTMVFYLDSAADQVDGKVVPSGQVTVLGVPRGMKHNHVESLFRQYFQQTGIVSPWNTMWSFAIRNRLLDPHPNGGMSRCEQYVAASGETVRTPRTGATMGELPQVPYVRENTGHVLKKPLLYQVLFNKTVYPFYLRNRLSTFNFAPREKVIAKK